MPTNQFSKISRHIVYNSPKLRENCCANCKTPFIGREENLKMHDLISTPVTSTPVSIAESISTIFDGYLKLQNISLNQAVNINMCIPCTSTITSLFRVYKKFMGATAPTSLMKDIIKESPIWDNATEIITGNNDSEYEEPTTPEEDFQQEDDYDGGEGDSDGDWQGGDDMEDDEYDSESSVPDVKIKAANRKPFSIKSSTSSQYPQTNNSAPNEINQDSRTLSAIKIVNSPRVVLHRIRPPNIPLDKSLTYRQILEKKSCGKTTTCNYVKNESLAPGEDPREIKELKRGSRVCPYCDWTTRSMTELHDHLLNVAKIETYVCPYPNCEKKFAWDCFYVKHLASVHSELIIERGCEKCPKTFNTQYELLDHESRHVEGDLFVSDVDNPPKKLKKYRTVKFNGENYYPCFVLNCGKLFLERQYLKRHHKNCHEAPTVYRCDSCPWVFPREALLVEHSACHTGELAFTCDKCGEKFTNKKSMNNHIFHFHRKRAPDYKGNNASKKKKAKSEFSRSSLLRGFSKKMYKCDDCGKAFNKRSNLVQHKRQEHLGLDPFECKICSQRFVSDETRIFHEQTFVHKEFPCPDCSKVFYKQARLDAHSDAHIPILREKTKTPKTLKTATHICEHCGRLFKLPQALGRHLKTHNTINDNIV